MKKSGIYFEALTSPSFFTPMLTLKSTQMSGQMPLGFGAPYGYTLIVTKTPLLLLFYRGGSLVQPLAAIVEDTRWEAKMTQQLTAEDDDDAGEVEDKTQKDVLGGSEGDDNIDEEVYRSAPSVVHRNPPRNRHPPFCSGTHSPGQHD
ncbi:hypothetical protein PVK06_005569 [Gossypium arboreum]|uniref:Uncharacterized protein n=1 Tax=Gossypium arboreum TaxID=29729 RepID=A0ABR0QUX7_GOSAR|nr:hypothetical protein PVK06_005569 [Gossypium arboreum]